jgi:hypothetical protein
MEPNFQGSLAHKLSIFTGVLLWLSFTTTSIADTWSISPNPASVNENSGSLTFTVTRSDSSTATTVYASTVHDQGYSNNGYYVGVLNQAVGFSIGQTTAQVTVTINDLGLTSGSETFRFIVQQNPADPVNTYLATDNFTIVNNDGATTWSISPNPVSVNENAGSLTFTITRSSSATAAMVYASTVQDQGYSNNGFYGGILNQAVGFSTGQTTAQVTVTINDLGLTSGGETFRFIVQQNPTDPVGTYLATDNFTIINNDGGTSTGTVLAGFDTRAYPTDQAMAWLRQNSNLAWVGYYLYPAPSRNVASNGGSSWMGHFPTLATQGWTVAPIYIGEQDPAHESQDPGNSSNPSTAKGAADGNSSETNYLGLANSAVPLLMQEGFPVGTTVYLDIETSGAQSQPELDYISAWCSAVGAAGYIPGIYCLTSAFASIATVEPNAPFWIANPTDPSPAGTPFPTMDPSSSGVPNATAWQYETAPGYTIAIPTSILPSGALQVDLDVVKSSQPSQPIFGDLTLSGGTLQTTLSGLSAEETVVIYSSTDLKVWTPIQTNIVTGSTLILTNTINPAVRSQFFRAVVQ